MTDVPLRDHIDQRLDGLEKLFLALRDADEKERTLLREMMGERLEGMNNMRHDLERQAKEFAEWRSMMEGRLWAVAALPVVMSMIVGSIAIWAALQ